MQLSSQRLICAESPYINNPNDSIVRFDLKRHCQR
jgi:hypothetical protein